jgi:hypothetical protein
VRDGRTRWRERGEEGENKIAPPSPGQNHIEAMEKPHRGGEKKTQRKRSLLSGERRELFGEEVVPSNY